MYSQWLGVGNVGKGGAELRYTAGGTPVAAFSVAINKTWTKDGQKQEKTTWHKITVWNKLAEVCAQYVTQGMKVLVIGEVEESKPWTDKEGNMRSSIEITASLVKFLGGNKAGETHGADGPVADDGSIPF